jgi:hypothetical protein
MKCPHCLVEVHPGQPSVMSVEDKAGHWQIRHQRCPACDRVAIFLDEWTYVPSGPGEATRRTINNHQLWPRGASREPVPQQVPEVYASLAHEAALILNDSPRASAALSRRCLQQLLRDELNVSVRSKKLGDEIQHVLDNKLVPSYLADSLHTFRDIGNLAAHSTKNEATGEIVDVEPGEAAWTLNVLDGMFDFLFVEPAKATARKAALDARLGRS